MITKTVEDILVLFNESNFKKNIENIGTPFLIAELESSRGGKGGMQAGTVRENIVAASLEVFFKTSNVDCSSRITESDKDLLLFNQPLSIKTKTGLGNSGIKVIWTTDYALARKFISTYNPKTNLILVKIKWDGTGFFYLVPLVVQKRIFQSLGRSHYLKPPASGRNCRGAEFTSIAIKKLINEDETVKIPIKFPKKDSIKINPTERWRKYF